VFTELQKWSSLKYVLPEMKDRHFTLIHKTHLLWSKLNLYKKAHFELQKTYKINNFKYSKNLELFIDSTDIYNKKGVENIGYGPNPKKQISRLSIICDINKNIHSITLVNANTKIINPKTGTEKPRIRKTMPYDNQTITTSLNDLTVRKVKYRKLYLVGDGGYATKEENKEILHENFNVQLVYPHKKNQKIKTPEEDKIILKNRYIVENAFADVKNFKRICVRQDKLKSTYMGFVFLGCCMLFKK